MLGERNVARAANMWSADKFLYNFIPRSNAEMTCFPLINTEAIPFEHTLQNCKAFATPGIQPEHSSRITMIYQKQSHLSIDQFINWWRSEAKIKNQLLPYFP